MKGRLKDIEEAADVVREGIVRTPFTHSKTLSNITGADIQLKFENYQFTASFKDRGALAKLSSLTSEERKAGVIAMSAGNHAQAVAYHAQNLGLSSTIVMPYATPDIKVQSTQAFGAEVVLHGRGFDEAASFTRELAKDKGLVLIHPYDDEKIISGQGTIALEMLQEQSDLDVLIIPVGGGGLIAGCATAAKLIQPGIEVIGVQTGRFPAVQQALQGVPIECQETTIADGIAVKKPGELTVPLIREFVDEILLVKEDEIEKSILLLLEVEKTVVEGAGAVGLTAVLEHQDRFEGRKVGLILSGGNIDLLVLSSIMQRGLARSGRLVRLCVGIPDVPGTLANISCIFGELNANIIEVRHQRAFTNLSLRVAEVEFIVQALGMVHVREILKKLKDNEYDARILDASLVE